MNLSTVLTSNSQDTAPPPFKFAKVQQIRCPNCGSHAEKLYSMQHHTAQIQCPSCDYFLLSCTQTGVVHEAYAPGIAAN
jgi:DNA-directed RNA polymerase subunit RPC12/RpoP